MNAMFVDGVPEENIEKKNIRSSVRSGVLVVICDYFYRSPVRATFLNTVPTALYELCCFVLMTLPVGATRNVKRYSNK